MKTFNFSQYKVLLKVLLINTFNSVGNGKKKKDKELNLNADKKGGARKILSGALGALCVIVIVGYLVMTVMNFTVVAVESGDYTVIPYFLMGIGQMLVVFLGMGAIFNLLYFSDDNALLQSLPVSNATVFAAKFTVAYISQLALSVILLLPSMLTFGITAAQAGVKIWAGFYVYAVLTPLVSPLIPLLAVSFISIPIMYLLSLIKNRTLAKNILSFALSLGFLAIYFAFIFSANIIYEEEVAGLPPIIGKLAEFSIYNYNWVEAMLGFSVPANTAIYLACVLAAGAIMLLLSIFAYKKAVSFSLEDGGSGRRKRGKKKNEFNVAGKRSFLTAFFIKDLKSIISEPTMVMSFALGIVLLPVFMFLMGGSLWGDMTEFPYGAEICSLGFLSYFTTMIMCSTNYFSLMGVSLEGKNFSLIKSLPISVKDFVKSKLLVANLYNVIISSEFFIVTSIISQTRFGPLIAFFNALIIFTFGFGMSCFGLYCDIKKPTLLWENMQKLTKNNKRVIKPMFLAMGFGLIYLIAGFVIGLTLGGKPSIAVSIYLIVFAAVAAPFAAICFNKLKNNMEEMFDKIEC